jgi:hypothetical protein
MRVRSLVAAALVALAPSAARGDEFHGNECRRTEKQIAHYENVLVLAQDRGNDLWEDATRAHLDRLQTRFEQRCPEQAKADSIARAAARAAEETRQLIKLAAQAAITYFTGGFGGLM